MNNSRTAHTLKNVRVSFIFFILSTFLSFFSRKYFLERLGDDFIGLTGTLTNVLGYLNLAELGISGAIGFLLYEPIQQGNRNKTNELMTVLSILYRKIGAFIAGLGFVISLFLPILFNDSGFSLFLIYFIFYSYLSSSLLSYFFNYKQVLLTANQKNYVVASFFQSGIIAKTIAQMLLLFWLKNYYIWILVELFYGIIYSLIINWRIKKEYSWLKTTTITSLNNSIEFKSVQTYVKRIFIHKFKDFILTQSDQIFVFAFVSLKMVAYYGNYVLVINKLSQFFTTVLDGVTPSIGNLVAEGDSKKIVDTFWELMAVRYFIAGTLTYILYILIEPLIILWLGEQYLLSKNVLYAFLINFFIMQSRGAVDTYNAAFGLYGDTWSAWVEAVINICITLILGHYIGILGILLGKTVSLSLIILMWKPYYLFKEGFSISITKYWYCTSKYYLSIALSVMLIECYRLFLNINPSISLLEFFKYAFLVVLPFIVLISLFFYLFTPGAKECTHRFIRIVR